jgi:hypothetical protein
VFGLLAFVLVVSPPHFRAAPGWHVGSTRAHACVGVPASRCVDAWGWASTVRYRDCRDCVPPHRTLAHLPPSGIAIQLDNGWERPARAPVGHWPVRIRRKDMHRGGVEGIPRRVGYAQWFLRSGRIERYLWVWFGRAHPTRRQLARANAELRAAR